MLLALLIFTVHSYALNERHNWIVIQIFNRPAHTGYGQIHFIDTTSDLSHGKPFNWNSSNVYWPFFLFNGWFLTKTADLFSLFNLNFKRNFDLLFIAMVIFERKKNCKLIVSKEIPSKFNIFTKILNFN